MPKRLLISCFISIFLLLSLVIVPNKYKAHRLDEATRLYNQKTVTPEEVQQIIDNLRKILPNNAKHLQFSVDPSTDINAYASADGRVVVLQGMIDFVESNDELALVIGHEIAHHLLSHVYLAGYQEGLLTNRVHFEAMADMLGARLAQTAGYNPCAGKALWERMREKFGNDILPNGSHPNLGARIYQFEQICNAP